MKFRSLAQATAGLFLLAFTSLAQITSIEGDVKGTDGQPVVGAVVKIERTDVKGNYQTKTDKKGRYFHTGLPIGLYNITVQVDGKDVDKQGNIKTSPGDPKEINFDLKQAAARQAAGPGMSAAQERGMSAADKAALEKNMKDREAALKKRSELNESFNAGLTAVQNKQWPEAVTDLTKAAEVDPTQPAVWAQLAEAYVGLGSTKTGADFDAAMAKGIEAYAKAIELKPDDAATHNNYALALAKAKKFPEMQAELAKAVQLDPPGAGKYYYNLGALLVNSGQNDTAGEAFKKAIDADPNYADAYYQYGVTLVAKAQIGADGKINPVPGTVDALQKYLSLQPNGTFAQAAKDMLATLGSSVETKFQNPDAGKSTKKKK
jgi:tetratricopeptide (TPR) repeat protein